MGESRARGRTFCTLLPAADTTNDPAGGPSRVGTLVGTGAYRSLQSPCGVREVTETYRPRRVRRLPPRDGRACALPPGHGRRIRPKLSSAAQAHYQQNHHKRRLHNHLTNVELHSLTSVLHASPRLRRPSATMRLSVGDSPARPSHLHPLIRPRRTRRPAAACSDQRLAANPSPTPPAAQRVNGARTRKRRLPPDPPIQSLRERAVLFNQHLGVLFTLPELWTASFDVQLRSAAHKLLGRNGVHSANRTRIRPIHFPDPHTPATC